MFVKKSFSLYIKQKVTKLADLNVNILTKKVKNIKITTRVNKIILTSSVLLFFVSQNIFSQENSKKRIMKNFILIIIVSFFIYNNSFGQENTLNIENQKLIESYEEKIIRLNEEINIINFDLKKQKENESVDNQKYIKMSDLIISKKKELNELKYSRDLIKENSSKL